MTKISCRLIRDGLKWKKMMINLKLFLRKPCQIFLIILQILVRFGLRKVRVNFKKWQKLKKLKRNLLKVDRLRKNLLKNSPNYHKLLILKRKKAVKAKENRFRYLLLFIKKIVKNRSKSHKIHFKSIWWKNRVKIKKFKDNKHLVFIHQIFNLITLQEYPNSKNAKSKSSLKDLLKNKFHTSVITEKINKNQNLK